MSQLVISKLSEKVGRLFAPPDSNFLQEFVDNTNDAPEAIVICSEFLLVPTIAHFVLY